MSTLSALLINLASTLPGRVLIAMGMGFVTYSGYSVFVGYLITAVTGIYNNIPSTILQIMSLAGFGQALGIILGAMSSVAALKAMPHLGKISGNTSGP